MQVPKSIRCWAVSAIAVSICCAQSPVERTKQVLDLLLTHKYDAAYALFSPEMQKAISLKDYTASVDRILTMGPLKSQGTPEVKTVGNATLVTIPLHWESASLNFIVNWNSTGQIQGTFFRMTEPPKWQPPAYSNASSFTSREVTIDNDEWKLPGTLTLPTGKGPFPAVVLVHGSGPNDRDESLGGNKPFRDLAEGLGSRGVAVLRYEKRTRQYAAKMATMEKMTVQDETVDDAVKAVDVLRKQPEVDPKRIFVLGHSVGGYVAPRIAQDEGKLAGLIILAGNARPIEDLILEQAEYLGAAPKNLEAIRAQVKKIKTLEPGDEDAPPIMRMPASYWLDLKGYDAPALAKKLNVPMLILQGERDYQVPMKDFALWKAALEDRKNVTFHSYPSLNHLFIAGEGKSTPAEYQKPGHVDLQVIKDVADWISATH
jgi:dienelactone hydrolase